tara:strand:+ start:573 stop:701 length:129 start_codon:yes stop_codon:yes gene_type:complete
MINKLIDMIERLIELMTDEDVFTIVIFLAYLIIIIQIYRALS